MGTSPAGAPSAAGAGDQAGPGSGGTLRATASTASRSTCAITASPSAAIGRPRAHFSLPAGTSRTRWSAQDSIHVRRRAFVEHVLAGIEALPITEPVARVHADISADLSARGEAIGAHDLWIATTALAHGLGVATRNTTHFQRIDSLRVVTTTA